MKTVTERICGAVWSEAFKFGFLSPMPSQTNAVLAKFNADVCTEADVHDYLHGKPVLVRRFQSPEFGNCMRFTIGREYEMSQVIEYLRAFFVHNASR